MRGQILTPWVTGDDNHPQLPDDHALPTGASWMDATGQQSYQLPTSPNAYVVEVWNVSQTWLNTVAADSNYVVLWSAADDAEPSGNLTSDQLTAIRSKLAAASEAQLDRYIGTTPNGRTQAEVATSVAEWSSLFLRQDEMDAEAYAALVARYPAYAVGVAYAAGELIAYEGNLYEIVQAHTSQVEWLPSELPALYTHAVPVGTIPIWVQPLGSSDAYSLGDKVTYNGQVWESTFDGANVWPPGTGGLWVLV